MQIYWQQFFKKFVPILVINFLFFTLSAFTLNKTLAQDLLPTVNPKAPPAAEPPKFIPQLPPPPLTAKAAILLNITADNPPPPPPKKKSFLSIAELFAPKAPPPKPQPVLLYEYNADEKRAPASLTKLLSALTAIDKIESTHGDYSRKIAINEMEAREGNYLREGDHISLIEALNEMIIFSDNGAAYALARAIGEDGYGGHGYDGFIAAVNVYAKKLGFTQSSWRDPTGLPTLEHYSTARELAELSRAALKNPTIAQIARTPNILVYDPFKNRDIIEPNTNKLLVNYPGCYGLKTGYTKDAGYCLSAVAEKRGTRLLAVVLGTEEEDDRFINAAILLDWGFTQLIPELQEVR